MGAAGARACSQLPASRELAARSAASRSSSKAPLATRLPPRHLTHRAHPPFAPGLRRILHTAALALGISLLWLSTSTQPPWGPLVLRAVWNDASAAAGGSDAQPWDRLMRHGLVTKRGIINQTMIHEKAAATCWPAFAEWMRAEAANETLNSPRPPCQKCNIWVNHNYKVRASRLLRRA